MRGVRVTQNSITIGFSVATTPLILAPAERLGGVWPPVLSSILIYNIIRLLVLSHLASI